MSLWKRKLSMRNKANKQFTRENWGDCFWRRSLPWIFSRTELGCWGLTSPPCAIETTIVGVIKGEESSARYSLLMNLLRLLRWFFLRIRWFRWLGFWCPFIYCFFSFESAFPSVTDSPLTLLPFGVWGIGSVYFASVFIVCHLIRWENFFLSRSLRCFPHWSWEISLRVSRCIFPESGWISCAFCSRSGVAFRSGYLLVVNLCFPFFVFGFWLGVWKRGSKCSRLGGKMVLFFVGHKIAVLWILRLFLRAVIMLMVAWFDGWEIGF